MDNLKLEVWKTYVDGAGRAIKITFKCISGSKYCFYSAGSWFSEDGKRQGTIVGGDLVKEIPTISEITISEIMSKFNRCTAEEYTKMVIQYCTRKMISNSLVDTSDLSAEIQSL
jgi:hypothetical protein